MKLFLDENISSTHASDLRAEGYNVVAVLDVGLSGSRDEDVMRFSIQSDRILVTLDADFANVIRFPPDRTPGIVRIKIHPPTEAAIRQSLRKILLLLENTDLRGKLAVLDQHKIRIR